MLDKAALSNDSATGTAHVRGTNYLLAVAIDDYPNYRTLHNCVRDLEDLQRVLLERYDFEAENTVLIKNEAATQKNILRQLDQFYKKIAENDSFLFFFSGHGENLDGRNIGCLIPYDAADEYDFMDLSLIKNRLDSFKAKHIFVVFDSCFSGLILTQRNATNLHLPEHYPSRFALTSGRNSPVADGFAGQNSPFMETMLFKLRDNNDRLGALALSQFVLDEIQKTRKLEEQLPDFGPISDRTMYRGQFYFYPKNYEFTLASLRKEKDELARLNEALAQALDEATRQRLKAEKARRASENLSLTYRRKDPVFLARAIEYNYLQNPDNQAVRDAYLKLAHQTTFESYTTFQSLPAAANCLAFSGDGTWLAIGFDNDSILLHGFDRNETALLGVAQDKGESGKGVLSLVFSKDASLLVAGHSDFRTTIWGTDGQLRQTLLKQDGQLGAVNAVDMAADQTILTCDTALNWWDAQGTLRQTVAVGKRPVRLWGQFVGEGHRVLVGGWDINEAGHWHPLCLLYDLETGQTTHLEGHASIVNTVAAASLGNALATGDNRGNIAFWNQDGTLDNMIQAHEQAVQALDWSLDGSLLVSAGGSDGTAKVWNRHGQLLKVLHGHEGYLDAAIFNPDQFNILTAGKDKTLKVWNMATPFQRARKDFNSHITALAWREDQLFYGSWDGGFALWDLQQNQVLKQEEQAQAQAIYMDAPGKNFIDLSQGGTYRDRQIWGGTLLDGQRVLMGSAEGNLLIFDAAQNKTQWILENGSPCWSLQTDAAHQTFLSRHSDGLRLWHMDGTLQEYIEVQEKRLEAAALSPDGRHYLVAFDGIFELRDLSGTVLARFEGHQGRINYLAFSPNDQHILSASSDHTAKLWDRSGQCHRTLEGHTDFLWQALFAPNGQYLLTVGGDGAAKLWDLEGRLLALCKHPYDYRLRTAAFSPDGTLAALGGDDGMVLIWDISQCRYLFSEAELAGLGVELE